MFAVLALSNSFRYGFAEGRTFIGTSIGLSYLAGNHNFTVGMDDFTLDCTLRLMARSNFVLLLCNIKQEI